MKKGGPYSTHRVISVSYTHLDVYKRQPCTLDNCDCCHFSSSDGVLMDLQVAVYWLHRRFQTNRRLTPAMGKSLRMKYSDSDFAAGRLVNHRRSYTPSISLRSLRPYGHSLREILANETPVSYTHLQKTTQACPDIRGPDRRSRLQLLYR